MRPNREALFHDQSPDNFEKIRSQIAKLHGYQVLFSPHLQFLREAYVASRFASAKFAKHVKLLHDTRPDFEIENHDGIYCKYESTQADRPDRKLGEEYKLIEKEFQQTGAVLPQPVPQSRWLTPDKVMNDVKLATQKKCSGRYDPNWGLVIYLLGWELEDEDADPIQSVMHEATYPARNLFSSVSVLTNNRLIELWQNGQRIET